MFGMGTGGSLRLLSPETCCARPFCCRTFCRRRFGNTTASRLPSSSTDRSPGFAPGVLTLRVFRTLKTAQVGGFDSPDQGSPSPPSTLSHNPSLGFGSGLSFRFSSLRSRFGSFSYSLLPFPYSLSPRSSPRPISITKLHALPRFHR